MKQAQSWKRMMVVGAVVLGVCAARAEAARIFLSTNARIYELNAAGTSATMVMDYTEFGAAFGIGFANVPGLSPGPTVNSSGLPLWGLAGTSSNLYLLEFDTDKVGTAMGVTKITIPAAALPSGLALGGGRGLSYNAAENAFYASFAPNPADNFVTSYLKIDASSFAPLAWGEARHPTNPGSHFLNYSIGIDTLSGKAYTTHGTQLFEIDLDSISGSISGSPSAVASSLITASSGFTAAAMEGGPGMLFAADGSNNLVRITFDPYSATIVGNYGALVAGPAYGLAYLFLPEPTSGVLLALALLALARRRRPARRHSC